MSISQLFPEEGPTLNLNFAGSRTLDPRITFARTSSATFMGRDGLVKIAPANSARFDHRYNSTTGEVESLGLLIEEQSANSLLYSNDFSQNSWTKQNSHPVPTQDVIGPDGVSGSGWRFYRTATNQYIFQQVVGAGTHTLSAWVRSEEATGDFVMQGFNATNGTMQTSFTATNEWKRFNITISPTVNTNYYPCIPTNINKNFYVYGAQVELNKSFMTSYIPTEGSTATRNPDRAFITGSNFTKWYNISEGTLFVKAESFASPPELTAVAALNIPSNFPSNRIDIRYYQGGVSYTAFNDAGLVLSGPSGFSLPNPKFIVGYKQNTQKFATNGSLASASVSFTPSPNITHLQIGTFDNFSYELNGCISQLTYYPVLLTDNQLITLTK
jgi:hypothetical protein